MIFLELMLQQKSLKQLANDFQRAWRNYYNISRGDQIRLFENTIQFQHNLISQMRSGEWIGFSYPSFVKHITRETEYALRKVRGDNVSDEDEIKFWNHVLHEHAALAAHLLDPSEKDLINTARNLERIGEQTAVLLNTELDFFLVLSRVMNATDQHQNLIHTIRNSQAESIIPPLLSQHVLQEGDRAKKILSLIGH